MSHGYKEALEAAGAKIKDFKEFGDYQGTWIAILENGDIVEGNYGSCGGCDAFQAEFDTYGDIPKSKLARFGKTYLMNLENTSQAVLRYVEKSKEWGFDKEDQEIFDFLKSNL